MKYTFQTNSKLMSVVVGIVGVVLIIAPQLMTTTICFVIGACIIANGTLSAISYFNASKEGNVNNAALFFSIVTVGLGIFVIVRGDVVISIIPFVVGLVLMVNGIGDIQKSIAMKNYGYENWNISLISSILKVILGVFLLISPFESALSMIRLMGFGLIYMAITSLFTVSAFSKITNNFDINTEGFKDIFNTQTIDPTQPIDVEFKDK